MSVDINVPKDRTLRPQITWLRNQTRYCQRKNPELYNTMAKGLMLDIKVKFASKPVRVPLGEIEDAHEKLIGREIKSFRVVYINYLGWRFESRKQFINILENMLIDYYQGIVQYLKNWKKPAPKIQAGDESSTVE